MVFKCPEVNGATEMTLTRTSARSSSEIPRKCLGNFSTVCRSKTCFPVRSPYLAQGGIHWSKKTFGAHSKRITIVSFRIPQVSTAAVEEEVQIDIIIRLITVSVLLSSDPSDSASVYRSITCWRTPVLPQTLLLSALSQVLMEWAVALPWNVPAPRLVLLTGRKLRPRSELFGALYLYCELLVRSHVHTYSRGQ